LTAKELARLTRAAKKFGSMSGYVRAALGFAEHHAARATTSDIRYGALAGAVYYPDGAADWCGAHATIEEAKAATVAKVREVMEWRREAFAEVFELATGRVVALYCEHEVFRWNEETHTSEIAGREGGWKDDD
jgi:hypothetical protein